MNAPTTAAPAPVVHPEPLWRPGPERIDKAGITRYQRWLARERGLHFDHYEALWQWSVDDLEGFWASIWDFCGVKSHSPYRQVLADILTARMGVSAAQINNTIFPGLNYTAGLGIGAAP